MFAALRASDGFSVFFILSLPDTYSNTKKNILRVAKITVYCAKVADGNLCNMFNTPYDVFNSISRYDPIRMMRTLPNVPES